MFIWINWKALLKIIHVALSKTYLFIGIFTKAVTIFSFFISWQQSHGSIIKTHLGNFQRIITILSCERLNKSIYTLFFPAFLDSTMMV